MDGETSHSVCKLQNWGWFQFVCVTNELESVYFCLPSDAANKHRLSKISQVSDANSTEQKLALCWPSSNIFRATRYDMIEFTVNASQEADG